MSEENVEIVRKVFDAYSRGDLQGMLDHLAPEFEFHPSGRFMDTRAVYRGHQGWIEFWEKFHDAWESVTITVDRVEAIGERVLLLGTFQAMGRESGVSVTLESAWIHTLRDGRLVETWTFPSWDEGLEAAGLSE